MIIGVTGTNGAGKGVVVDYLKAKGFAHYSVREYLAEQLTLQNIPINRSSLRDLANELRKTEYAFFIPLFIERMHAEGAQHAVIESIRHTAEVAMLKKHGGLLLVIDADRQLRYERIVARGSATDKIDYDTFVIEEEREWYGAEGAHDMNLIAVMQQADYTIKNEGTLEELHAKIDEILTHLDT